MADRKSKRVQFIQPRDCYGWYGILDEWFANTEQIPIEKFGSQLVYYPQYSLDRYVHNIDPEFDSRHRCTPLNTFYAAVFTTFCVDHKDRSVVTKQSATRAFDVFHIDNRALFNTLLYELLQDKDSVIRAFYGFMSEEESQKLLEQEGQWLLRMDRDGFIVTEATSINDNGSVNVKNYRLIYDCGSFYMNGRSFAKLAHVTEEFPMELAYCASPYFAICYNAHPSYYSDGGDHGYGYWRSLISTIQKVDVNRLPYFRCMMWGLKVIGPPDEKTYIQQCAQSACNVGTVDETIDILRQCLKLGAEMNVSVNESESIAVHIAKAYQKEGPIEKLREFLWSNGFDPNSRDSQGYPTLWYATSNRNWNRGWNRKLVTIWTLHPDLDINIQSRAGGGHVLHWTYENIPESVLGHPKININVQNSVGETILDYAITSLKPQIVAEYIKYGADAARTTSKKGSYLHLWINSHNKSTDVLEMNQIFDALLDNGVKIDSMDADGLTALHLAAQKGTIQIVRALLERGANINGHPDSETTPLHLAAERGDVEIVTHLLERGADRTKRNSAGQLPKDVASLSAKELFDTSASLPSFSFTCKYLPTSKPVQSLPFPRGYAQCFFIGEYFYIWGGIAAFLNWWDEYGYVTLELQVEYVNTCWRTKLSDTPLAWEKISINSFTLDRWDQRSCAPVGGKIWFNTTKGETYAIWDPKKESNPWSHTPRTATVQERVLKYPMFDFGDRLLYPLTDSLGVYDKAKSRFDSFHVDQGDMDFNTLTYQHAIIFARNSFWVKNQRTIFTMNLEKRRWLKSTTLPATMDFLSFIVSFGDRFILALVRDGSNEEPKCKLLILDLDSGVSSFHDIEFDFKGYSMPEDRHYEPLHGQTIDLCRKHEPAQYEEAKQKVINEISQNKFPFYYASLAVQGTTLAIFGGAIASQMWFSSDIFTLDLSSLKPYLSLEQLAGIEASKNNANYTEEQLKAIPIAIRSKFNLW